MDTSLLITSTKNLDWFGSDDRPWTNHFDQVQAVLSLETENKSCKLRVERKGSYTGKRWALLPEGRIPSSQKQSMSSIVLLPKVLWWTPHRHQDELSASWYKIQGPPWPDPFYMSSFTPLLLSHMPFRLPQHCTSCPRQPPILAHTFIPPSPETPIFSL